jgi:hypothetical protein
MRRWITATTIAALIAVPLHSDVQAGGGNGYFSWVVSGSSTDPNVPTGPDGTGFNTVYLWLKQGCGLGGNGAGMSAAEMRLVAKGDWGIVAFTPQNSFLNAGTLPDLLLAVGGCPVGPVVAGNILATGTVGGINLGRTGSVEGAGTVDCEINPILYSWPEFNRFEGYATASATHSRQNHGAGCDGVSVEQNSWGTVKALYR